MPLKINVRVTPRASRNELKKLDETHFQVRVTAPPVDGEANEAVVEMLSKHYKIAKSKISLVGGIASRDKIFEIDL